MQVDNCNLEISWSESVAKGPDAAGDPYLFVWLSACWTESDQASAEKFDGKVVVISRNDPSVGWMTYESPVSKNAMVDLRCLFSNLEIETRVPNIKPIYDQTTEVFYTSIARMRGMGEPQAFTIATQGKGFEGKDSEALRKAFQGVLALTGYSPQNTMFSDAGVPQK